jgi:peptidylprolyl isomerase
LEFTVGAGQMIAGFDAGVLGMTIGEKKTIQIDPDNGYGQKDPSAIIEFPTSNVPEGMQVEIGMKLNLQNQYGQPVPVEVIEVKEEVIIMDANHFLAGKDLVFEVELVEIVG